MTWGVIAWTSWAALVVWIIICIVITVASENARPAGAYDWLVAILWIIAGIAFIATVGVSAQAALT